MRFNRPLTLIDVVVAIAMGASFVAMWISWVPDNTLPADRLLPASLPKSMASNGAVSLWLTGRTLEVTDGRRSVRLDFVVVNGSDQPVEYVGYAPHGGRGTISPLYGKQVKIDGEWQRRALWCGNCTVRMPVRPGQAGKFTAYIHESEPTVRIGFHYWRQGAQSSDPGQYVWSDDIPRDAAPLKPG